jgi:hypothetical protein
MTTPTLHASRRTKKTAIGELPVEWGVSMLGKCATLERGKFAFRPRTEPRFYGGKTPFVQTGDVSNAPTVKNGMGWLVATPFEPKLYGWLRELVKLRDVFMADPATAQLLAPYGLPLPHQRSRRCELQHVRQQGAF